MRILAALGDPAGVDLSGDREMLAVQARRDLGLASTAVVGGGLRSGRGVVALNVPGGYAGCDPAGDILAAAAYRGLRADVGLMTAVPLCRARLGAATAGGVSALCLATAGVERPLAAGSQPGPCDVAGTINLIVLLNRMLAPAAALNVMTTVVEAKVLALLAAGVRTPAGEPASGTATDAIVVAYPLEGGVLPFGGPATSVGFAAAAATRQALGAALELA